MNENVEDSVDEELRPIYTAQSLAKRWSCSAQHIRDLVKSGKLPAFRVGRLVRIPRNIVEEFERGK